MSQARTARAHADAGRADVETPAADVEKARHRLADIDAELAAAKERHAQAEKQLQADLQQEVPLHLPARDSEIRSLGDEIRRLEIRRRAAEQRLAASEAELKRATEDVDIAAYRAMRTARYRAAVEHQMMLRAVGVALASDKAALSEEDRLYYAVKKSGRAAELDDVLEGEDVEIIRGHERMLRYDDSVLIPDLTSPPSLGGGVAQPFYHRTRNPGGPDAAPRRVVRREQKSASEKPGTPTGPRVTPGYAPMVTGAKG